MAHRIEPFFTVLFFFLCFSKVISLALMFAPVIPKNLRHYLKHSKQPFRQRNPDKSLFERCILMLLLLREKRVLLSPMTERKVVCGKFCVTEGCCLQLLNKAQNDCFCLCRAFWSFWAPKGHDRTTKEKYKPTGQGSVVLKNTRQMFIPIPMSP